MNIMNNRAKTGRDGELAACLYLEKNGYEIVERNYRHRRSEIDIIAKKGALLVFVEVKTKSYNFFGFPEESVDNNKVKKVIEGADHYVHDTDWNYNIRFDIIAVNSTTHEILHFEDAFH